MGVSKVRLYIRVRLSDGRSVYANPAWNRNRTLRAGYAVVDGTEEHHPKAIYYLRYLLDGKRRWHAVGPDADTAIAALRRTEHDLQAIKLGISAPRTAIGEANASGAPDSISLAERDR